MFDRLIRFSLSNRLLVVFVYGVLLTIAFHAMTTLPVDVFPEFAPPQVVIQTQAPGLAPEDVESLVSFPIETALNGTPNIESVRSASSAGLSTVSVVFAWNSDIYLDRQLVNERLQAARARFPSSVDPPVMLPVTSAVGWLVKYALTSDTVSPIELRTYADWVIRPRLLAIPGIASVVAMGGGVKQYQVEVAPDKLRAYGLTLADAVRALENGNQNAPGGFLVTDGQEQIVTGLGRIRPNSLDDIAATVVAERGGTPILLSQIAAVKFGEEVKRGDAAYMGKPAVIGTVSKLFGADTLATTYAVEQSLKEIQASLPAGIALHTDVFRQATFIERSIDNLKRAMWQGSLVVIVILFVFLFNVRTAAISFLAIPLSLLLAIVVMKVLGVGINVMTLGGLAIAIGEVVDDAIIDVENVFRRLRENRSAEKPKPTLQVVFEASREIRNSVVFATAIVGLVFAPLLFLTGLEGRMFMPLGIAYLAAILSSLVIALTITPVLCHLLLASGRLSALRKETSVVAWLKARYVAVLRRSVRHPGLIITGSSVLVLLAAGAIPRIGTSFLPEFHEGNYVIALAGLPGTSLSESLRVGAIVQRDLMAYPEIASIDQRAGRGDLDEDAQPPNFSEFDVTVRHVDHGRSPAELEQAIRARLAQIPGVAVNVGQFISHRMDEVLSGIRGQIVVKIFGPELATLRTLGDQARDAIAGVPGVVDLQLESQLDVPAVHLQLRRADAARYGITAADFARVVSQGFNGAAVSQVLEGQRAFDLFVRFPSEVRDSPAALASTQIDTRAGQRIPLSQIATLSTEPAPYFINRENVQRRIVVQCNVEGRGLGDVARDVQRQVEASLTMPTGYSVEYSGQADSQQRAQRALLLFGLVIVAGIFVILFQAFGSVVESVVVMANLPLALIGGVAAVAWVSGEISVPSIIGFISLFGIATRNGIMLVTHYRHLVNVEGMSFDDAILQGAADRLVPILMTAATAALALFPLVMGDATGKEIERPLAVVILGGLVTSTALNMIVVPTLFRRFARAAFEGRD